MAAVTSRTANVRSDLKKRTRLEDHLNELLGWTGLGHCDGGSIGSGTLEACCLVVDCAMTPRRTGHGTTRMR